MREFQDAIVARISNQDIAARIYRDALRRKELSVGSGAKAPEFQLKVARRVEDLDAMVVGIGDINVLAAVYRDA